MTEHLKIPRRITSRCIRVLCALVVIVSVITAFPFTEIVATAFVRVSNFVNLTQNTQTNRQDSRSQTPSRNYAQRLKLTAQIARAVIFSEAITSAIVIDPAIATVEVKGDRIALVTGLMIGSTILIISGKSGRTTYALDVARPQVARRRGTDENRRARQLGSSSGSYRLYFTPGANGGPSLLRQGFEYQQKLRNGRKLRLSGEMFRFFGGGERALTLGAGFGTNRLMFGLDSPTTRLDLLDSALEISPLGFNGFSLRGPHFVSTRNSRWRGLEFFAGNAGPRSTLFNQGEGRLAGAIIPIIQSESLRVRSGLFFIAPRRNPAGTTSAAGNVEVQGGMVLHTDARYTPGERTTVEGDVDYSNGGLSWRAKLDLQRGAFNFYGELSSLNRRSPMIAIGAQSGGHKTSFFSLHWQPTERFSAFGSYNRTTTVPLDHSSRLQLNSAAFLISATFRPTSNANLAFSFNQQVIEAPASTFTPFLLKLQTRTAVIKYDQRFNRRWTNNVEARLLLSREANTDAPMNRGLVLREQLRYAWNGGAITGFVNYRSNTPSLEGLILRNPSLLPVELRAAFAADPVRFLLVNRDALPLLLNGVDLPLTANRESGLRLQSTLSRLNFAGELVYSVGKFMAKEQRTLLTSIGANLRLDAANSVQINVARVFAFSGAGTRTSLTAGYVHRFGAGGGDGFQFSSLPGLHRGHIQGRVFDDLNGNGQEDAGEIGIVGMKVQTDGNRSVITDSRGDFNFGSLAPGDFDVELISDELGVTQRASRAMLQHVTLSERQTVKLSFGLTNSGFAAGRVFNDLLLTGAHNAGEAPGLARARVLLYRAAVVDSKPLIQTADGEGFYEFRNLAPGKYLLEIDTATLPPNFSLPAQTTWLITVSPLQPFYLDLPFAAQRAVAGTVYLDRDRDGKFDPQKDTVVSGARITCGNSAAVSDRQGSYFLRNLPAGRVEVRFFPATGGRSGSINLELGPDPTLQNDVNLTISE